MDLLYFSSLLKMFWCLMLHLWILFLSKNNLSLFGTNLLEILSLKLNNESLYSSVGLMRDLLMTIKDNLSICFKDLIKHRGLKNWIRNYSLLHNHHLNLSMILKTSLSLSQMTLSLTPWFFKRIGKKSQTLL